MKKVALAILVLVSLAVAERAAYVCKVAHLGTNVVAIVCTNGADPTGSKAGDALIISCGK